MGNLRCGGKLVAGLSSLSLPDTWHTVSRREMEIAIKGWKDLKPHPINLEIYGDCTDNDLLDSVRSNGIYNPLLVTYDDRIISGHRRWDAARKADLDVLPVVVFDSDDELDIEEALIESNRQREKTNEQIGREYKKLKEILNQRQSRQGSNQYKSKNGESASDGDSAEAKRPTREAAKKVGVNYDTANKASQVVDAIDQAEENGDKKAADQLRQSLGKSVNGAHKKAKDKGLIETKPKANINIESVALSGWGDMDKVDIAEKKAEKAFNKTNDNVEWALWTWNPITGCLHDCDYCYARDIANRYYEYLPKGKRFEPNLYPDRLWAPKNTKVPDLSREACPVRRMGLQNVFVCSMADLFGKWVPEEWINAVLNVIRDNPQWNYLMLTKFPIRMSQFEYPDNVWLGTSVDQQGMVGRAEKAFQRLRDSGFGGVTWLSCEPMMERLTFEYLGLFDWLVMGGSSRSAKTPEYKPPFDDTVHLYQQAKVLGLPVYFKTNLGIEDECRVREYPQ